MEHILEETECFTQELIEKLALKNSCVGSGDSWSLLSQDDSNFTQQNHISKEADYFVEV